MLRIREWKKLSNEKIRSSAYRAAFSKSSDPRRQYLDYNVQDEVEREGVTPEVFAALSREAQGIIETLLEKLAEERSERESLECQLEEMQEQENDE